MAAGYLSRALPSSQITLIESPLVSSIGVGEGTIPALRGFLRSLDITDDDLVRHANATFKLGIRFEDWKQHGSWWWHPFFCLHAQYPEEAIIDGYLAESGASAGRLSDLSMSWRVAGAGAAPRVRADKPTLDHWQPKYATHFDASLFADLLRRRFAGAGRVQHVIDHVTEVCVVDGSVSAVVTEQQGRIEGDFFVDCTGFRRVLMQAVSDAAFVSFQPELPCDRAVTLALEADQSRPYTTATALSAGWAWQIDLSHRTGVGYVYSSRHLSPEEAEAEVRQFAATALGLDSTTVAEVAANHLGFRAGHLRDPLVANCAAIGLAEGFVEPLEATSLGLTAAHISELAGLLMDGRWADEAVASAYNRSIAAAHDDVKNFLLAHYCFTNRTDTDFWREAAALAAPLRPTVERQAANGGGRVFCSSSWRCLAEAFDLPLSDTARVSCNNVDSRPLTSEDLGVIDILQGEALGEFVDQRTYLDAVRLDRDDENGHGYRAPSLATSSLAAKLNSLDLTAAEAALMAAAITRRVLHPPTASRDLTISSH